MLNTETRAMIARGLGLLGSACIALSEVVKGEEVLRLAVQYASDGVSAPDIFIRLGTAMMHDGRPGEAIAPLRRAANLGADGAIVWPMLAKAFFERGRLVAAYGAVLEARAAGVPEDELDSTRSAVEERLGKAFTNWRAFVERTSDGAAEVPSAPGPTAPR